MTTPPTTPSSLPRARAGRWRAHVNRLRRWLWQLAAHRMVFGERSQGRWLPHTRIAPSTCIDHPDGLHLDDHVFIGPFCFIEASGGVHLDEGVQLSHHVSIVTHSSHRSVRLLGRAYVDWPGERPGWVRGPVRVGAYSFIGPHTVLEAGTRLGRGCIVRAGSVVRGAFEDFSVIAGNPAQAMGDARDGDAAWLQRHPEARPHHEAWAGPMPSPHSGVR